MPEAQPVPDGTEIEVVLVDDQDLFREGVRTIVDAQPGLRVVGTAGDGREALEVVDRLAPDVVLMDVRMPGMDGVEATRHLFSPERVAARTTPLQVVVLTTFDLDDRAATAIRHGAAGFLLKDVTPARLAHAIRTVQAGNAVLGPQELTALMTGTFRERTPVPAAYDELTEREQAGLRRGRPRAVERRDRRRGLRRGVDGEDPRRRDPAQARAA